MVRYEKLFCFFCGKFGIGLFGSGLKGNKMENRFLSLIPSILVGIKCK